MKKYLIAVIFSLFALNPSLQAAAESPIPLESVVAMTPGELKEWKYAYHNYNKSTRDMIVEWVPGNETLENWSRIITLQAYDNHGSKSVKQLLSNMEKAILHSKKCVYWNVIQETQGTLMFEFCFDSKEEGPEYNIMYMLIDRKAVAVLSYGKKSTKLEEQERLKVIAMLTGKLSA